MPARTCLHRIGVVWFHSEPACMQYMTDKLLFGSVYQRDNESVTHMTFILMHFPWNQDFFVVLDGAPFTPCISAKHRQNETLSLWLLPPASGSVVSWGC